MGRSALVLAVLLLHAVGWAQRASWSDKTAIADELHRKLSASLEIGPPKFSGRYARVTLRKSGADSVIVYLKGSHGYWHVVAGPGTGWSPSELDQLKIPVGLR